MDPSRAAEENKKKNKRDCSDEGQEAQNESKRSCPSSSSLLTGSTSGNTQTHLSLRHFNDKSVNLSYVGAPTIKHPKNSKSSNPTYFDEESMGELVNHFVGKVWPKHEAQFRQLVAKAIGRKMLLSINSLSPSPSEQHESRYESGTSKFQLGFLNEIAPRMLPNTEIKSKNGQELRFGIFHRQNCSNAIITTGPLSTVSVEFIVDEEDEDSGRQNVFIEPPSTWRGRNLELISGNGLQTYLKDGVGVVKDIIVTENSYWKCKKFRLRVRVLDENILMEFGTIHEANSGSFKVTSERMKGLEKHYPPKWNDELQRLEGIGKIYQSKLSSSELSINTVGDLVEKIGQVGHDPILKILELSESSKVWKKIFDHAMKCKVPTNDDQSLQVTEANSNKNFEVNEQNQSNNETNDRLVETQVIVANSKQKLKVYKQHQSSDQANEYLVETKVIEANFNQNLEVGEQNQSFDQANDYLVGTGVFKANSIQNLEVYEQDQSFDQVNNHLAETDDLQANSKQNLEVKQANNHLAEMDDLQANSKQNLEVKQANNHLAETDDLQANSKQNLEVNYKKSLTIEIIDLEEDNVEANSKEKFDVGEEKKYCENDELIQITSSIEDVLSTIDFNALSPLLPLPHVEASSPYEELLY